MRPDETARSQYSADPAGSPDQPGPGTAPENVRRRADTGDPRVDDALSRLDDLAGLAVAEHPGVFEYVHEKLAEALGDLEGHGQGGAGDQQHGAAGGPGPGSSGR
ncbi:MAG TPA: hypothetical protein VIV12_14585 [Streptosporangiaceae bacterium]